MRRITTRGRSRIWRGVAVVGISLGLVVTTTTPSQALVETVPFVPASATPIVATGGATVAITGATGSAVGASVCAATIYCGLAVVAGIAIAAIGTGLLWTYKGQPNTDVVGEGSVNWVKYPYKAPNTPEVIASYRFGEKPTALKEYPGTPNVQHCAVVASKTNPTNKQLINCNNAGTFQPGQASPNLTDEHRLVYDSQNWEAIGFAVRLWVGGSVTSKVWEIALIDKIVGGTISIPEILQPDPVTVPETANPDRRVRIKTRCTRADGTHYYVTTYSTTYKQTDAQRPEIVAAACTQNPNDFPSGIEAGEEKPGAEPGTWVPSPLNPGAAKPDLIIEAETPDTVTAPNYEFRDCLTGAADCKLEVGKIKPDGTIESCTTADCTDIEQWVKPDAPAQDNPYRCRYNGTNVAVSECTPLVPDVVATIVPLPTAGCGLTDIACWLEKIFVPRKEVVDRITGEIKTVWDGSAIGRIPFIIGGFSAPFFVQDLFEPKASNCEGPTIILPKNFGVTGVGVEGDYVIQPLKACDGLSKTISETWRDIAEPTVYVTGGIAVVNTLLGAVGLSLRGIRNGGR